MRRLAALVVMCGCSDDAPLELDARDVDAVAADDGDVTDRPIDAPPIMPTSCTPTGTRLPPAPQVPPATGIYCAAWTRVDGVIDAFPRYYDRVEITLTGARWWASDSGGQKEYNAAAAVDANCLLQDPFIGGGGVSGSDPVRLCWESASVAHGTMAWCNTSLDAHWDVRLDACP